MYALMSYLLLSPLLAEGLREKLSYLGDELETESYYPSIDGKNELAEVLMRFYRILECVNILDNSYMTSVQEGRSG